MSEAEVTFHVDNVNMTVKAIRNAIRKRHIYGKIKPYLGQKGYLALMDDKIARYLAGENVSLVDIMVDCAIAVHLDTDWEAIKAQLEELAEQLDLVDSEAMFDDDPEDEEEEDSADTEPNESGEPE